MGGCPSASSIAVMPRDQTSALASYMDIGPLVITSGAIQKGVPITVPRREMVLPRRAETPKSASLIIPDSESRRLPALTSR